LLLAHAGQKVKHFFNWNHKCCWFIDSFKCWLRNLFELWSWNCSPSYEIIYFLDMCFTYGSYMDFLLKKINKQKIC